MWSVRTSIRDHVYVWLRVHPEGDVQVVMIYPSMLHAVKLNELVQERSEQDESLLSRPRVPPDPPMDPCADMKDVYVQLRVGPAPDLHGKMARVGSEPDEHVEVTLMIARQRTWEDLLATRQADDEERSRRPRPPPLPAPEYPRQTDRAVVVSLDVLREARVKMHLLFPRTWNEIEDYIARFLGAKEASFATSTRRMRNRKN